MKRSLMFMCSGNDRISAESARSVRTKTTTL
jgi:hypothetical protein